MGRTIKTKIKGFQIRDDQVVPLKSDLKKRSTLVTHSALLRYFIDLYLKLPEEKKQEIADRIVKIERETVT